MNKEDLIAERDALQRKLDWLGIRSTGSEKLEDRIREINYELGFPTGYKSERYLKSLMGS